MFTKIAMILVLVTVALGGIGISMAAAQNDTPGNNVGIPAETQAQIQTQTQAQTQTMTMAKAMTMTQYQQGNLARTPFSFKFGTQEEFVPGNPWTIDEIITGLGHMFGGYGISLEVRGGRVAK